MDVHETVRRLIKSPEDVASSLRLLNESHGRSILGPWLCAQYRARIIEIVNETEREEFLELEALKARKAYDKAAEDKSA